MSAIRLTIPTAQIQKLQQTIGAYANALGRDARQELLRQGQLLVRDLIKTTPPRKQAAGKKRIEKDANKALLLIDPDKTTNRELKNRLKEIQRQKDYEAATKIYNGSKKLKDYTFEKFSTSYHKSERLKGGDRLEVPKQTGKATLDKREHKDYTREVQSRVGRLKASWYPAAQKLMVNVPQWVSKHAIYGFAVGSCYITLNNDSPHIYIRNRSNGQKLLERVLIHALDTRQKNMIRDIQRRLENLSKKKWSK